MCHVGIFYIIFIPLRTSHWCICKILSVASSRISFYITLWVLLWVGLYLSYLIRSINFSFLLDFPKVFGAVNVKQTSWYTSELNY